MSAPDLSSFQSDPPAQPVLVAMAAGKWRKARDTARDLIKKDRAKYLPLLIAANAGLAEDLLGRRLDADAATVIEYLKTIAPPEYVADLAARLARNKSVAIARKGSPEEAAAAAWTIVSAPGVDPSDQAVRAAADRLVTGVEPPPGDDSPELRAELAAARAAVHATANAAWEEARAALRGVPAGSIFGAWRLFLRGVRCVHAGETDTARQCFEALPLGSAVARGAWAYRPACGLPPGSDAPPAAARTAFTAALCGASPKAAAAVAEADALWRAQDVAAAMLVLSSGMGREIFPSENPGLGGALTELFFANDFQRSKVKDDALDKYAEWLERRLKRPGDNKLSPLEEKCFRTQLLRLDAGYVQPSKLYAHAERIVALDAQLHGEDPLRAAAVWDFAAAVFPGDEDDDAPPWHTVPGEEDRTEALRRSVALDPSHPPRILALANELAGKGDMAEVRALLTRSLELLPEHPGLLAKAGIAEHAMKNPEGVNLLRKAFKLDPALDEASDALFSILSDKAGRARKFDPAVWDELESVCRPTHAVPPVSPEAADVHRQRWFVRLGRALEDPAPPRPVPPAFAAPSPFVQSLAEALISTGNNHPSDAPEKDITWKDLCWALLLIQDLMRDNPRPLWMSDVEDLLIARAEDLCGKKALISPQGAVGSLAFARTVDAILEEVPSGEGRHYGLPLRFVKHVAAALSLAEVRRSSHRAALAAILIPPTCPFLRPCLCGELRQIATKAMAAGDRASADEAEKQISLCGTKPAPPWSWLPKPRAAGKKPAAKKAVKKKAPAKKAAAKKTAAKKRTDPRESMARFISSITPPGGMVQDELFADIAADYPPGTTAEEIAEAEALVPAMQQLAITLAAMEDSGIRPAYDQFIEKTAHLGLTFSREDLEAMAAWGRTMNAGATPEELQRLIDSALD